MIALPAGYVLIELDNIDSTNDEAKRRAEAGASDGTVIWAQQQAAGRGRRGRPWESPPGNLYCSLLLRPKQTHEVVMQLGFVAALALYDCLAAHAPDGVSVACKWPNDLLVGGRKCAGILMETAATGGRSQPDWSVLGFGLNVMNHPTQSEYPATSLNESGFPEVRLDMLLGEILHHFDAWRQRWLAFGFSAVRDAWMARAFGLGEAITVRLHGETLHGTFADMDRDGALLVQVAAGQRRITAGDVFYSES